jgi:hypothetical protein
VDLSRGTQICRSIILVLIACTVSGVSLQTSAQDKSERLGGPAKQELRDQYDQAAYQDFLKRERAGEIPSRSGAVRSPLTTDVLVNDNNGATGTALFTQSETSVLAFENTVVVGFNDAGSNTGNANKFTGFSRSTDGGATFVDGGALPTNAGGDAGDPVLARDETTGRIYFATLGFTATTIQVFRSDDNGVTWQPPVNGTPGGNTEDKEWITVDNFSGTGNGNVYLISRNFGPGNGVYLYRSGDGGSTFGPSGGTLIVAGNQGAFVAVGPDHAVYAFWFAGSTIQMRKSTDFGISFGAPVTVASGLVGGTNGDLGLTGIRQGTVSASGFRSNEFPHVAVNPISGNLYVTYDNDGPSIDKADVFFTQSTNGGATWDAPVKVNDDGATTDQWQPTIAVTPDGTGLGVFYYSRQEDPVNNNLFKYYGRTGVISGSVVAFQPSVALSDVASLPEFGRDAVINSVYMGDYNQAVATPGYFHVVWSDNRDDLAGGSPRKDPNIYYKKVLAGTLPGANILVGPTNVNFGNVIVGGASGPTTVTITNIGDAPLTVNTITSPVADFSTGGLPPLPLVLPSLGTATLNASFSPLSTGTQNSSFDIVSDALNTPTATVNLHGRGFLPAANDLCTNAIALTCGESVNGNTADATVDGVATCGGVSNTAPGLWYSVVGNGGLMSVSTCTPAASFDTRISVFSGSCGSLDCVGANDDFCSTGSQVTWSSASGTDYYILVHGFASQSGTFTISTSACPAFISVTPPALNISLPVNGTGPGTLEISNTAGAGSQNLTWSIIHVATSPAIAPSGAVIPQIPYGVENLHPLFQITDRTLQSLRAQNVSSDIVSKVGEMRNAAPATKEVFFEQVGSLLGKKENAVHRILFDESMVTTGKQEEVAGSVDAPAPAPDPRSGWNGPEGVHSTSDIVGYSAAAVPFVFEDISATGTVIAALTGADDGAASITPGFTFDFYSSSFSTFSVSSNGLITFVNPNTTFTNADLTTTPPQAAIAPFWDDQHVSGTANSAVLFQVLGAGSTQHLVIQWNEVRFFTGGTAGDPITYQAALYADGSIQFNYLDLVSGSAASNDGASATVGIKDAGTQGPNRLLLAFNNGPNAFVGTGKSTLITPSFSCPWISSVTPPSGSISPGGSQQVVLGFDAAGLATGTYHCEIRVASNATNSNPVIIPATLTVSASPAALISVTPPVFNIAVPVNGTGSGTLDIANTVGAGGLDLSWLVTSLSTAPADALNPQPMRRDAAPATKEREYEPGKILFGLSRIEPAKTEDAGSLEAPAGAASPSSEIYGSGGVYSTISGYTAAAVSFAFEDISTTGTVITPLTGADDGAATLVPGFTFEFFSASFDTFSVSSNGLITFRGPNTAFTNSDLTTAPSQAAIAPFWDDQRVIGTPNSKVLFQVLGAGPTQHLVIQWNEVSFFSGGAAGDSLTYQAVLFADGSIQFNYLDLVSGTAAGNNGASTTVGIKDSSTQGPDRLLLAFNNGPNTFVGTGQSTLISPIRPPGACGWISSFAPGSGSVAPGNSQQVTVGVDATGLATGTYNCEIKVFSSAANGSPVIVPATLTVGNVTDVPVVSSPIIAGATSVNGSSTEANGTVVQVFVNSSSAGSTTVAGGNWTKSGLAALVVGDSVKATATAAGKVTSPFSAPVVVQGVTAPPVVNAPILAGATSVSGTSSESDGTSIQVFVNSSPAGSTTVTGGVWTKSGLMAAVAGKGSTEPGSNDKGDRDGKAEGVPVGLVAGDTVKATATAASKITSAYSNSVVVQAPGGSVNVVSNPGFESGKQPWVFFTDGSGAYTLVSPGASGSNAARLAITTPGTNTQFYQAGITLEAATLYRLTFKALSSTGHNLSVFVQRHDAPYTNYGLNGVVFDLTTTWQTFTVQFTTTNFPPPAPSNARLRFRLNGFAGAGDVYSIDDVVLEKVLGGGPVATKINVETAANGTGSVVPAQTVDPGDSITVYAVARDAGNNYVGNVSATWSLIGVTGSVVPGDLVPSGDTKSAKFKGNGAGTAQIQAASGVLVPTPSGTITVPVPPPATNLVVNGGFESGTASWTFQTNGAGSFTAVSPGNVGAKAGQVSITTPGTAVQLFQRNISLTSGGQYRLSFKAICNTGHDVQLSVFKHASPFTPYGLTNQVFNLTTSWASYSVDFTASGFAGTVGDARLRFWVSPYDASGDVYQFDDVRLEQLPVPPISGAEVVQQMPTAFALGANFPNPFNPSTTIIYTLPEDAHVTIEVFDVLGRSVAELVNAEVVAGYHDVVFDASAVSSGLYFYRMTATGAAGVLFSHTQKMVLAK